MERALKNKNKVASYLEMAKEAEGHALKTRDKDQRASWQRLAASYRQLAKDLGEDNS